MFHKYHKNTNLSVINTYRSIQLCKVSWMSPKPLQVSRAETEKARLSECFLSPSNDSSRGQEDKNSMDYLNN